MLFHFTHSLHLIWQIWLIKQTAWRIGQECQTLSGSSFSPEAIVTYWEKQAICGYHLGVWEPSVFSHSFILSSLFYNTCKIFARFVWEIIFKQTKLIIISSSSNLDPRKQELWLPWPIFLTVHKQILQFLTASRGCQITKLPGAAVGQSEAGGTEE